MLLNGGGALEMEILEYCNVFDTANYKKNNKI